MSTPDIETVPPHADRDYARRIEVVDYSQNLHEPDGRQYVHIPHQLLLDGVDITHLVVGDSAPDLGFCIRMPNDSGTPTSVLEVDLLPGYLRVTPGAYGPDTAKVELLVPGHDPINLLVPRPPDGVPLVVPVMRDEPWRFRYRTLPGELVRRERIQIMAEEILFARRPVEVRP